MSKAMFIKKVPSNVSEFITFDSVRRAIGFVGGPLCALLVYLSPIQDIVASAHMLLAILTFICIWWITEPVPIAVTALLVPVLIVVFNVADPTDAFASFADPIIFLFLGGFILAKAMSVHGLDKRIAYRLLSLKWVGGSTTRIFLIIGIASALCSGWISNTATAAMMLPIALGLLSTMQNMCASNGQSADLTKSKYATGLMLMVAYGASIGGVLTPIGTPPNLIVVGLLDSMADVRISFFTWMIWGSIAMIAFFALMAFVVHHLFPTNIRNIEGAERMIAKEQAKMGRWTRGQKNTAFAFLIAVCLWVAPGVLSIVFGSDNQILAAYNDVLPESTVALLAALLLFVLPTERAKGEFTLKWSDAVEGVDWGTLLLFGGGLSMGSMMYKTGLSL